MGYVGCGSKLTAIDARAYMEDMGVKIEFIPAGKHQHNLVERAHRRLWSTQRTIREMANIEIRHVAASEAT